MQQSKCGLLTMPLAGLKQWWTCLSNLGPLFGYHPNAAKTCLVVREGHEGEAKEVFEDTGVCITTEGKVISGLQ